MIMRRIKDREGAGITHAIKISKIVVLLSLEQWHNTHGIKDTGQYMLSVLALCRSILKAIENPHNLRLKLLPTKSLNHENH